MLDTLRLLLLTLFALLLFVAAVGDVRRNIISNRLNSLIAVAAPLYWAVVCLQNPSLTPLYFISHQLLLAFGVFAVGALIFYFNIMGGGDVKLLTAMALWIPPSAFGSVLFVMSVVGGVVASIVLIRVRVLASPAAALAARRVPYGVAIAAGGLAYASQPFVNAFMK